MTTSSHDKKVMSACRKIIKIWDEATGEPWTSVEPIVDLNDVAWCKDTGMLLTANEGMNYQSSHTDVVNSFHRPPTTRLPYSPARTRYEVASFHSCSELIGYSAEVVSFSGLDGRRDGGRGQQGDV
jgi:hypothetical protein